MIVVPRRYQLTKQALAIVNQGHPWLFRDHVSSAAAVFADGQWLRLVDGNNAVVGWAMYSAQGAIAMRVLRLGAEPPTAVWVRAQVDLALAKRAPLRVETDALRLIHGENDGLAAVVVEQFGAVLVAQSYSRGADALTRYAAAYAARSLGLRQVVWRPPQRRVPASAESVAARVATGLAEAAEAATRLGLMANVPRAPLRNAPAAPVVYREGGLRFAVDIAHGQKTGAFLDLRGLRRYVAALPLAGAHVLNLFSFTGTLAHCAEAAGAQHIWSVDQAGSAHEIARAHHATDAAKHTYITADIFRWLYQHAGRYQLVIVDPPAMTSRQDQVGQVLQTYQRMYRHARNLVAPGGQLVAACCTSRVTRAAFRATVERALGPGFALAAEVPPELDHPVRFPQADYLKIFAFVRDGDGASAS